MRTVLLALSFIMILTRDADAQITLTSASYPAELIGADTLRVTVHDSPFPPLMPVAAALWDMTMLVDTTPVFFAWRLPVTTYHYADSNLYHIGTYGYKGNAPCSITSLGLYEYGINTRNISYSLTTLTLGPTDTLYIPQQNTTYTSPLEKIIFPATYHSSWQSSYRNDIGFELSVGAYSLVHAPGTVRTYTVHKDTVVGWGQMRVKTATGGPSSYFDVLQVESTVYTTDSFFLNGSLAPPAILALLSLVQGQKDTSYYQSYYRAQEVTPLVKVDFRDAGFWLPYKATTHMQRLVTVGMQQPDLRSGFSVYPNPLLSRNLFIQLPSAAGEYSYSLSDITGRQVQSGDLPTPNGECRLKLNDHIMQGVYYLHISRDGVTIGSTAISLCE